MRQRLRLSSLSPGAAPPAVAPEALQQSLRLLLDALSEFVRHANATEMPADVSYRLPGIGCLAMARLVDFTIWSDDRDCPGEVAVIFHCRGDDALETWPATTAQYFETRDYLLGHHLRCPEAVAGVPSSIVIAPEVPVEALFRADYAAGIVPHIVRVLNAFEKNATAYTVMGYEEGRSLQEILSNGAVLDEAWLKRILVPVVDGLREVHGAGFIHRDIKPANIYIREDQSPVLIDFGSARRAIDQTTRTLTTLVTPGFAPFEQYYAKSDRQGPWTDIYALGATAYRAITGKMPADALARSEALLAGEPDPYVPAAELGHAACAGEFLTAIDHAMAFREGDRPQDLRAWREELGGTPAVKKATDAPALAAPTRKLAAAAAEPTPRWRPPRRLLAGATAAGMLLMLAGSWFDEPEQGPPPLAELEWTRGDNQSTGFEQIDELLRAAEGDLGAMRFVGGDGNNAGARYRQVLALDPGNSEARNGLRSVVDYLRIKARTAARAGDFETALEYREWAQELALKSEHSTLAATAN